MVKSTGNLFINGWLITLDLFVISRFNGLIFFISELEFCKLLILQITQ